MSSCLRRGRGLFRPDTVDPAWHPNSIRQRGVSVSRSTRPLSGWHRSCGLQSSPNMHEDLSDACRTREDRQRWSFQVLSRGSRVQRSPWSKSRKSTCNPLPQRPWMEPSFLPRLSYCRAERIRTRRGRRANVIACLNSEDKRHEWRVSLMVLRLS